MGVETKRRNVGSSLKLGEVVEGVASLLRNLKGLTVWWFTTYNEFNEYGDETSTMLYKMRRANFDSDEVRVDNCFCVLGFCRSL